MKPPTGKSENSASYIRPDGGYGWFIVLSVFICFVCIPGIQKANGLMFVYFVGEFKASNSAISTITLVQKLSETLTALIWSVLAERYGSRIVCLLGVVLLTIGFTLSSFSHSIFLVTLTYGVICGMAFPMVLFPAIQMLPRYFDKRLGLASALFFCGQSIGGLIVPLIVSEAVTTYGLNGSFIIMAAINLHLFIAAVLLKPFKPTLMNKETGATECKECSDPIQSDQTVKNPAPCRSISQCEQAYRSNSVIEPQLEDQFASSSSCGSSTISSPASPNFVYQRKFTTRYALETEEPRGSIVLSDACMSVGVPVPLHPIAPSDPIAMDAEVAEVQRQRNVSVLMIVLRKYKATLGNGLFLLLALSMFLYSFSMSLFMTFQQAHLHDIGYGDEFRQVFLIAVSSVAEFFSRLGFGFIIDRNWLRSHQWNQLACSILAVVIAAYPLVSSYWGAVIINCCIAVLFSVVVVYQMPSFNEFLGIEAAAIAQGLAIIPCGFGMISVQIGGALRDMTGSFRISFFIAAAFMLLSAANFQLLHIVARRKDKVNGKSQAKIEVDGEGQRDAVEFPLTPYPQSTNVRIDSGFSDKVVDILREDQPTPASSHDYGKSI